MDQQGFLIQAVSMIYLQSFGRCFPTPLAFGLGTRFIKYIDKQG